MNIEYAVRSTRDCWSEVTNSDVSDWCLIPIGLRWRGKLGTWLLGTSGIGNVIRKPKTSTPLGKKQKLEETQRFLQSSYFQLLNSIVEIVRYYGNITAIARCTPPLPMGNNWTHFDVTILLQYAIGRATSVACPLSLIISENERLAFWKRIYVVHNKSNDNFRFWHQLRFVLCETTDNCVELETNRFALCNHGKLQF